MLAGRAWEHLFWQGKLVYKVYDELFIRWIMETFTSNSWQGFLVDKKINPKYIVNLRIIGTLYALLAFMVIFSSSYLRKFKEALLLGCLGYIALIMSQFMASSFHIHSPFELALQFSIPLFLYVSLKHEVIPKGWITIIKISVAVTFISHGLYALYIFPIPESFPYHDTQLIECK